MQVSNHIRNIAGKHAEKKILLFVKLSQTLATTYQQVTPPLPVVQKNIEKCKFHYYIRCMCVFGGTLQYTTEWRRTAVAN